MLVRVAPLAERPGFGERGKGDGHCGDYPATARRREQGGLALPIDIQCGLLEVIMPQSLVASLIEGRSVRAIQLYCRPEAVVVFVRYLADIVGLRSV
jgi:hypothetical protein